MLLSQILTRLYESNLCLKRQNVGAFEIKREHFEFFVFVREIKTDIVSDACFVTQI